MTAGIIQLVAYGVQDIFLTKDPQITYFKVIYRRHTNFSTELIPQKFKTDPNFGTKSSVVLPKSGDLIRKIYIVIDLPNISEFTEDDIVSKKFKIAWVKKLGYVLIKSVEIEIGGKTIDKHYGEWLYIWNELMGPKNKGMDRMVGHISENIDFTNGKKAYRIYVPLQFWFCRYTGLALPIISLQYSQVKLNLELNDAKSCYINAPKNYISIYNDIIHLDPYEYIEQDIDGIKAIGKFIYFDKLTRKLYYNRIGNINFKSLTSTKQLTSTEEKQEIRTSENSKYYIIGTSSKFKIMPKINNSEKVSQFPALSNFNIKKCFLLIEYIFLDMDERVKFMQAEHEYLIEQVQYSGNTLIDSTNMRVDIGFSHPCKEIFWVSQLSYLTNSRNNDFFNFTSDYKYDTKGKFMGKNILKDQTIIFNGIERIKLRNSTYFDAIQPYQNHEFEPSPGINCYSFCLYPTQYQPSGPANFSKIDNINIQFTTNDSLAIINNAKVKIYGIMYNVLRISNGISGLVFLD